MGDKVFVYLTANSIKMKTEKTEKNPKMAESAVLRGDTLGTLHDIPFAVKYIGSTDVNFIEEVLLMLKVFPVMKNQFSFLF